MFSTLTSSNFSISWCDVRREFGLDAPHEIIRRPWPGRFARQVFIIRRRRGPALYLVRCRHSGSWNIQTRSMSWFIFDCMIAVRHRRCDMPTVRDFIKDNIWWSNVSCANTIGQFRAVWIITEVLRRMVSGSFLIRSFRFTVGRGGMRFQCWLYWLPYGFGIFFQTTISMTELFEYRWFYQRNLHEINILCKGIRGIDYPDSIISHLLITSVLRIVCPEKSLK